MKKLFFFLRDFLSPSTFFSKLSALSGICHVLPMLRFPVSFTVAGTSASSSQLFAMSGQAYKFWVLKKGFGFFFFYVLIPSNLIFPPKAMVIYFH